MKKDHLVGKVVYLNLPTRKNPQHRWIVKQRSDGRYIARAPKRGTKITDLDKKRVSDYGPEHLLEKNFLYGNVYRSNFSTKDLAIINPPSIHACFGLNASPQ